MSTKVTRQSRTIELAGAEVPSILLLPDAAQPVPAVLLLHAYSSTKERLADSMGRALAARGIGSLAIDLPLHGSRDDAIIHEARTNPLELMRHWKMALAEAAAALTWLGAQDAIDARHLNVAGYSLGSYIALQTAASDVRVVSVIVAAAGDLPATPWTGMVRMFADPLRSARLLQGRPLLMLHGRSDRTIPPHQAERLYDAATEPKELRWYNSGHLLPGEAADDAAAWLVGISGGLR